eukprot:146694_1
MLRHKSDKTQKKLLNDELILRATKNINSSITLESNNIIDVKKHQISFEFCKWLDFFIKWQIWWLYVDRNMLINCLGGIISIGSVIFWAYSTFKDIGPGGVNSLQFIILCIWIGLLCSTRIISMIYLKYYFQYPPYSFTMNCHYASVKQSVQQYGNQCTKYLNYQLKIYVIVCYLIVIGHYLALLQKYDNIIDWFDTFVSIFGILIPYTLFQCIYSFFTVKYQITLYYFTHSLNIKLQKREENILSRIINEYKKVFNEFQNDNKWLNIYMCILFIQLFANIWLVADSQIDYWTAYPVNIAAEISYMILGVVAYCLPLILFVISSYGINKEYYRLEEILWNINLNEKKLIYSVSFEENENINQELLLNVKKMRVEMNNIRDFYYLLHYIPKHKILTRLIGCEITLFNG